MEKGVQVLIGVLIVLIIVVGVSLVLIPPGEDSAKTVTGKAVAVKSAKPVFRIGASLPLTGPLAFIGEATKNGMVLAKEGLGDTKYDYEFYFEDDQLNPRATSTAANKLISVDGVQAIFTVSSGTGNVVTPLANQYKVLHYGIGSDANMAKGLYNFIHWTPPEEEAKVWVKAALDRGIKKVAILVANQQGEVAVSNAVKAEAEKQGLEITTEQIFNMGDKDFKTLILKAQSSGPDIYLLVALSPEIEILAKQMDELNIKEPRSGIESPELTEEKYLFEGDWYVNPADPTKSFETKYKARFGKDYALGGPNSHDNFLMLVTAVEAAGDGKTLPSTTDVALKMLEIKDLDGALGKLTVGADGIVRSQAVVRMIKDGKPVTLDH